jgi:YegS/Rv2252/BmrU family lipid kinase
MWREAEDAFRAAGVRCDVVVTDRPGHATETVAQRRGDYRAVFALGGDGTAIEVMEALAHTEVPVGVLPGGTGNLIAQSLGVPRSPARAVPALLDADEAMIDLGVLDGRRFAVSLGVGVDVEMIRGAPTALKRRFGVGAYVVAATRATLRCERFRVRVETDDEIIEREATSLIIANFGTVLNDLLRLGPGILSDDGALDLCVFSPRTPIEALRLAWRLFRKDFSPHPGMLYRKGTRFRVECTPPQSVQTDGELRGETPLEVRVEPRAVRLLVPRRDSAGGGASTPKRAAGVTGDSAGGPA